MTTSPITRGTTKTTAKAGTPVVPLAKKQADVKAATTRLIDGLLEASVLYASGDYAVAVAMAHRTDGMSWNELVRDLNKRERAEFVPETSKSVLVRAERAWKLIRNSGLTVSTDAATAGDDDRARMAAAFYAVRNGSAAQLTKVEEQVTKLGTKATTAAFVKACRATKRDQRKVTPASEKETTPVIPPKPEGLPSFATAPASVPQVSALSIEATLAHWSKTFTPATDEERASILNAVRLFTESLAPVVTEAEELVSA